MPLLIAGLVLIPAAMLGWGHLMCRLVVAPGLRSAEASDAEPDAEPADVLLLGLYALVMLGLVAPAFGPRSLIAGLLFLAIGAALLIPPIRRGWVRRHALVLTIFLAVFMALALLMATNIHLNSDAGLYHLPFIRWTAESGLVVGLGNVHSRHGFNSSWLSAAALFARPPNWAHGPLLFGAAGTAALYAGLLARTAWAALSGRPACAAFGFVASILLTRLVPGLNSFTILTNTDIPTTLLVLHALMLSVGILESDWHNSAEGRAPGRTLSQLEPFVLAATVALAITTKISSLPVVLLLLAVVPLRGTWGFLREAVARHRRGALMLIVLLAALPLVWVTRTFLISGCLLYPVRSACLPVPWFVGWETVTSEMAWIVSWARITPIPPEDPIFQGYKWVPIWATSFDIVRIATRGAIVLALAAALAAWQRRQGRRCFPHTVRLPLAACVAGLAVWFLGAPDPRFGGGFIVGAVSLPLAGAIAGFAQLSRPVIAVAALLWVVNLAHVWRAGVHHDGMSLAGTIEIPVPESEVRTTAGGVEVVVTRADYQCWLLPNPCVTLFRDHLRQGTFGPYRMYFKQPP